MRYFTCILFLVLSIVAKPQQYEFTHEMGTYSHISKDYTVNNDEDDWKTLSLSFQIDGLAFPFFGNHYDEIWLAPKYGFLQFKNNSSKPSSISFFSATNLYERYWEGYDPVSTVGVALDTIDGERVFKVEYDNVGFENEDTSNFINMQVWLYQSGLIEMRYGSSHINNIKWMGNYTGPWIGIDSAENQTLYLLTGAPQSPTVSNNPNLNLDALPPEGMIYRFRPITLTGYEEILNDGQFSIYPNPVTDQLHFETGAIGHLPLMDNIEIVDITGQIVLEKHHVVFDESLDISSLNPGIYFLRIGTKVYKINKI